MVIDANTVEEPRDLPIWPSGMARLCDGILEVTTGDGVRIATSDIIEIGVKPPRAGRLTLSVKYRAGLDKPRVNYWVDARDEPALRAFVAAAQVR